jgi:glucose-6-phosphate isomerase
MITTSLHPGVLPPQTITTYQHTCEPIVRALTKERARTTASPYVFLRIADDVASTLSTLRSKIQQLGNTRPIDIVMVIGIGGSSLGTQAIYAALRHHLPEDAPQLWCADTVDPITTHQLLTNVEHALRNQKNIVLVVISKSGTTLETCANASLYINVVRAHVTDSKHHIIVITDQGSPLAQYATQENLIHALIPQELGGRFSVFSAVGLVPLMLVGIDVERLLQGAYQATQALENSPETISEQVAVLAAAYDAGFVIHDTFVSAPHVLAYGAWYRQLLAESLGKCDRTSNPPRRIGMTPTVSCIASDLHSMAQLYLAGPQRTITTFVDISCTAIPNIIIPHNQLSDMVQHLGNQSVEHIHHALRTGIYTAYQEAQLPYFYVTSTSCTAETLGFLMQQQMIIVTMLGHVWHINPFDQPQVEDYKKWTRAALNKDQQ